MLVRKRAGDHDDLKLVNDEFVFASYNDKVLTSCLLSSHFVLSRVDLTVKNSSLEKPSKISFSMFCKLSIYFRNLHR